MDNKISMSIRILSGAADSNRQSPAPKAGMLTVTPAPDCFTPSNGVSRETFFKAK